MKLIKDPIIDSSGKVTGILFLANSDAFNPAKQSFTKLEKYSIKASENGVFVDNDNSEFVRKDVYELLFDKCERLEKENRKLKSTQSHFSYNSNSRSVFKLEQEVSRLKEQINRMYRDQKHIGHRYTFSNIPNDDNGRSLVKAMRFYLNKDTYNMRVRGQYLDKSKLERGESWKTYDDGQPLSKSKCIRLYIDKKKESA